MSPNGSICRQKWGGGEGWRAQPLPPDFGCSECAPLLPQGTKEDHAHTFLVHNIDGPALVGLSREKLLEWKIKPVDCSTILKGDLRRIEGGQVGWQPQDEEYPETRPSPPTASKPSKPTRRKIASAPSAAPPDPKCENEAAIPASSEDQPDSSPFPGATESTDWALTALPSSPLHRPKPKPTVEVQTSRRQASSSYLRKVMGDLHSSERMPLWKEEMIERVKRTAQTRKQRDLFSQSAPASSRTSTNRTPRARDAVAAAPSASVIEPGVGKRWARDAERKLFWYQDAIHEQELQSQLLEQKVNSLQGQVGEILEERRRTAGLPGFVYSTPFLLDLQVSETRVADAERVNSSMMDLINKLRRGRADFLQHLAKLTEREAAMTADMKHFAQAC
ncbi:MAG: hypothetical protein SGPRY_003618 [Prymnesium sp.]